MTGLNPQLVGVGDRVLCVRLRGQGPTVVLEAGGTGEGTAGLGYGDRLEEQLANFATVLTYDRAGSGRSAGRPRHRVAQMADDLDALLRATGCATPVVVVGWSSGGLVTEMFTVRHPDKTAGMVLLDPTCEMPTEPRIVAYLRLALGTVQLGVVALAAQLGFFATRAGRSLARLIAGPHTSRAGFDYVLHACNNPRAIWQLARVTPFFSGYVRETAAALDSTPPPDIPVRVVIPRRRSGLPPTYARRMDAAHQALTQRFARGELILAERTGHLVPIDRPDVVIAAVRDVLGNLPSGGG